MEINETIIINNIKQQQTTTRSFSLKLYQRRLDRFQRGVNAQKEVAKFATQSQSSSEVHLRELHMLARDAIPRKFPRNGSQTFPVTDSP